MATTIPPAMSIRSSRQHQIFLGLESEYLSFGELGEYLFRYLENQVFISWSRFLFCPSGGVFFCFFACFWADFDRDSWNDYVV